MKTIQSILAAIIICWSITSIAQTDTTFNSGNLQLNGTISIPSGNGPFPLVIMAHGSGPNDRNETFTPTGTNGACLYPNMVNETSVIFKDIADSLAIAGIATFRYDKRTYTHGSSLNPTTILVHDFADDLSAAVDFMKLHPSVDIEQIYLLGHSQGSNFIPVVAIERNDINGLISMGGNTTPIDTILARQNRDISYMCNQDTAAGDQYYNDILTAMGMVRNGSWPNNQALLGAYEPFWKSWIDLTDSVIYNYNSANLPLLVLQGDADFNVPPSEVTPFYNLDQNLTTVEEYNGLNHFFNDGDNPQTNSDVIATIINWILDIQTGIETVDNKSSINWTVYNNTIIIDSEKTQNLTLEIFDLMGRQIAQKNMQNSDQIRFQSTIQNGIYIATLKSNGTLIESRKIYLNQ